MEVYPGDEFLQEVLGRRAESEGARGRRGERSQTILSRIMITIRIKINKNEGLFGTLVLLKIAGDFIQFN